MHENIDERNQEMLRSLRDEIWFLIDNSTFDEIWRFEKSRNLDTYDYKELMELKKILVKNQILSGIINYD